MATAMNVKPFGIIEFPNPVLFEVLLVLLVIYLSIVSEHFREMKIIHLNCNTLKSPLIAKNYISSKRQLKQNFTVNFTSGQKYYIIVSLLVFACFFFFAMKV